MDPQKSSWIEQGKVLASAAPGGPDDYETWRAAGITLVVNLHTEPDDQQRLVELGMNCRHFPIRDFTAPSAKLLDEVVALMNEELTQGGVVAVHCHAGLGRTGTVVAAWLVSQGAEADRAIGAVRAARPGSIETAEQEVAVRAFAGRYRHLQE